MSVPGTEHLEKGSLLLRAHPLEFALGDVHPTLVRLARLALARDTLAGHALAGNTPLGIPSLA